MNQITDITSKKSLTAETHYITIFSIDNKPSGSIKKNLHLTHTQKTCLFKIFLVITIPSSLKLPEKNPSVTAPGAHMMLNFYDAQSFETPGINNHSFTASIVWIVFGGYSSQYFETPKKTITVSLHQVPIFCWDLIHYNVNTITELIGQVINYLHPEK